MFTLRPMDLNGIPLFSLLQNKLGYLSERQKMIAQNVANASTPGFTPTDLRPFDRQPGVDLKAGASMLTEPAKTSAGVSLGDPVTSHRQGRGSKKYAGMATPDSETTLNGNQVVLEEQMLKMSESRSDYDAAIGFYQKSLGLLHMAIRKPGG
ncbi:MAG: flagellar basal body protein [Caulobacteraceae bacterium]